MPTSARITASSIASKALSSRFFLNDPLYLRLELRPWFWKDRPLFFEDAHSTEYLEQGADEADPATAMPMRPGCPGRRCAEQDRPTRPGCNWKTRESGAGRRIANSPALRTRAGRMAHRRGGQRQVGAGEREGSSACAEGANRPAVCGGICVVGITAYVRAAAGQGLRHRRRNAGGIVFCWLGERFSTAGRGGGARSRGPRRKHVRHGRSSIEAAALQAGPSRRQAHSRRAPATFR